MAYGLYTHGSVFFTVAPASIPGFQECILNNRRYAIGQVFHPIVEVDGVEYEAVCYDCTCQPVSNLLICNLLACCLGGLWHDACALH